LFLKYFHKQDADLAPRRRFLKNSNSTEKDFILEAINKMYKIFETFPLKQNLERNIVAICARGVSTVGYSWGEAEHSRQLWRFSSKSEVEALRSGGFFYKNFSY
jgi:hypothetical protein